MRPTAVLGFLGAVCLAAAFSAPASAQPTDHPFALVNVIDLFNFFYIDPNTIDSTFDPFSGPPPNYQQYQANPRLGTQPCSIALANDRLWIGGFWNGDNWGGDTAASRRAWYAAVGVGEVRNIYTTSGFDGSLIKFPQVTYVGPTIANTDSVTGMDYDATLNRLYFVYDDSTDLFFPPPGQTQLGSYVAAVNVDPNSATYGQYVWRRIDPFHTPDPLFGGGDRFYGGVAVDPLDPTHIYIPQTGQGSNPDGGFRVMNVNDPNQALPKVNVKDPNSVCSASFYRQIAFDHVTGDMYVRNANAAEWIPRDPRVGASYHPYSYTIQEPDTGGNGLCNTTAQGDDVQLVAPGATATPGQRLIGPGPNGVIDTTPGGDDVRSYLDVDNERPIGNKAVAGDDGACNDDPVHGFRNGPFGQGQGVAIVSASSLADLSDDLVIGNSRRTFGANQPTDIGVFTKSGQYVCQLQLPCAPVASQTTGVGIFDLDYDAATGTLVVVQFEQPTVYVFRAQTPNGPPVPRYDYTRNGRVDLADFAGFQACFTGQGGTLSGANRLNCMRMNSDSDCDVDLLDFMEFVTVWEAEFGA